ncbi:hemerythrin domain-containing protein [Candidatus Woesearchaeota archaeon]|nr:hemerythrin domain-containing protein [Candidatus Woesearchaeota archaeon]
MELVQKMRPTAILSEEHKHILKITEALNNECDALQSGEEINYAFFAAAIDFIRNYADKFHHAKEEDFLFKEFCAAAEEGCVHCNPTEQMLHEHELGRGFVKGMEEALQKEDKTKLMENAREYAQLLQEHIFKEDNILYPMADEALSEKVQNDLLKKFKAVEVKKFPEGYKDKYINFAKGLGK